MLSFSLAILVAYLVAGFVASSLLRKGRSEDWAESLLASAVALPAFLLIAVAVFARTAKQLLAGGSGPTAHA
jgi:ACR3 family arsenite efflux pump ArsB